MLPITQDAARIFRITHISNVPWTLANGLHCSSSGRRDPNFRRIGNDDLIVKRPSRLVPISPGGNLSDYVPFYFTPRSPMLLNIKTGWNGVPQIPMPDVVVLSTSLGRLIEGAVPFVFTDRHAYLHTARFSSDLADLAGLDWGNFQQSDFARDPNDPGKIDRYQAEALVYNQLGIEMLEGVVCCTEESATHVRSQVAAAGIELPVVARREFFF